NKLRDHVKDAQTALGPASGSPDPETEKALARVEKLRTQLEQMARGNRNGQQQGQGQQGKQGQGQQGQGQQQGKNGQPGQQPGQDGQGQQGQGQQAGGNQPGQQQGQGQGQ